MAMINNEFWKAAASSWSWEAKPDIKVNTGSGGRISDDLLNNPWEMDDAEEFVDFNLIDYDATARSMFEGGDVILKEPAGGTANNRNAGSESDVKKASAKETEEETAPEILLDMDMFDAYLERENLDGFINCFKMLRDCGLPEELTIQYNEIVKSIADLKTKADSFKKIYEADLSVFIENYFPEALNLSVGYIEYANAKVSTDILQSTQKEIVEALQTLLIGVSDKIEEIQRFATIELRAAAKALGATMNADGFVDPEYKMN